MYYVGKLQEKVLVVHDWFEDRSIAETNLNSTHIKVNTQIV